MNRRQFLKTLAMTAAAAPAAKLIPAALQATAPAPYTTYLAGKEALFMTGIWKQRSAIRDADIVVPCPAGHRYRESIACPAHYNVRFVAGLAPDRTQRIRVKK